MPAGELLVSPNGISETLLTSHKVMSINKRPHTCAKDKLWFTYLLSKLVCLRSNGTWSLKRSYCTVESCHFSYFRDQETDKFKNLIISSLSTDTSVMKFSWRSVKSFLRKIADRQTNGQTNRQTNKQRALHNVLGGRNVATVYCMVW